MPPAATAATLSFTSLRRMALIGIGWIIIGLGLLLIPLPGPGIPVALVGAVILFRNSAAARRLFVRLKRRNPRFFGPFERYRQRRRRRMEAKAATRKAA